MTLPDPSNGPQAQGSCKKCASPLESSQSYCLNCGARAAGPRVPTGPVLEAIAVASLAAAASGTNPPQAQAADSRTADSSGVQGQGSGAGITAGTAMAAGGAATAAASGSLATLFASKSAASTGLALMVVGMIAGAAFSPPAPDAFGGPRVVIVQGADTPATGPAAAPDGTVPTDPGLLAEVPVEPDPVIPPTPTPPTPPTPKSDPSLGHAAIVLLPGGGAGQSINSASGASASVKRKTAHGADVDDWSSAFVDLHKKGLVLKGFKHNYGSGFANRMALITGAAPTTQMLATDDSGSPRGNEDGGEWEAKAYAKGVMVKHSGRWYLARLKAASDDEPGAAGDIAWQEKTADSSTEWSATATDSTPTQGGYQANYVVGYEVAGTKHYWKANAETTAADVPGTSGKWDDLGTETYTGPQPIRDVGCAGPVPAEDAESGCLVPSGQDDVISLITQGLASQDQAIRVYVDSPERTDSDYSSLCHAPKPGELIAAAGDTGYHPLDNPVVWFRSLTGAHPAPKLFKSNAATTSGDSPGVSGKWTAIEPWTFSGPQPADAAHDKGDWDSATTYVVGDLVRYDHGQWWEAAKTPTAADVPGKPADADAPVWTKRFTTSTPWDASSTASTETAGEFKQGYVVSTAVSGVTVYWKATSDTAATDEPGTSAKWLKIGAQIYAGPQPGSGNHDEGDWSPTKSYVGSDLVQYLDGNWYRAKTAINEEDGEVPGPASDVWQLQTESTSTEWDSEARDSDKANPGSYEEGWVVSRPISESSLCSGPAATGSVRPIAQMKDDLRHAASEDSENFDPTVPSAFPKLTLIIPSRCRVDSSMTCEDGTTGGPESLKSFLEDSLIGTSEEPGVAKSDIFTKDGFVVTSWDRPAAGSSAAGGALVLSAFTSAGKSSSKSYNIFSLTKTLEERFGVAGGAGMAAFIGETEKATALGRDVFPTR